MDGIQVFRDDFDNFENRYPKSSKLLGTFIAGNGLSATGKVKEFIENLEPIDLFLGWDGNVYPQIRTEHIEIK
jgi:hypothetical protein